MKEREYEIAVDYRICGTVRVNAKSFQAAMLLAWACGTEDVHHKEYIEDSWMVNKEMSENFLKNKNVVDDDEMSSEKREALREDILERYDNEEYWNLDILGDPEL